MHLTQHTDYALRVLLYLAVSEKESATINDVSAFYNISRNHLMKVVHNLSLGGFIKSKRGKNGGFSLSRLPEKIIIADVISYMEPNLNLLDCFEKELDDCPVSYGCRLKSLLHKARDAFMRELENATLADIAASEHRRAFTVPLSSVRTSGRV